MIGMKMQWAGYSNPDGWAGKGIGHIVGFESARQGFGDHQEAARRKRIPQGPAACLKLDHNGLTVWVDPEELEEIADDPDDVAMAEAEAAS